MYGASGGSVRLILAITGAAPQQFAGIRREFLGGSPRCGLHGDNRLRAGRLLAAAHHFAFLTSS